MSERPRRPLTIWQTALYRIDVWPPITVHMLSTSTGVRGWLVLINPVFVVLVMVAFDDKS